MKKNLLPLIFILLIAASCKQKEQPVVDENQPSQGEIEANMRLQETLATQDSLFMLINEISAGMNQIKQLEKIISAPASLGEMPSEKEQLINDMIAIQKALSQRRERLAELESKLKKSNNENATLLETIENLKGQIAQQQNEIASLNAQLEQANIKIAYLDDQIENLNATVTDITVQKDEARKEATQLTDELNTCFYAIGNKKELSEQNIMKSGFLRKTKILPGDFDKNYFTQADKRTLKTIPLHSKKAEVLTNQPAGSYQIIEENGQKVLQITDAAKFWELSNFLVVKID
ncbi:MAG: hypothetical protein J1E38_05840 [Paramuribaculum sp.]|nr:hypothetical protein [Paramuribaculum sp.]